MRTFECWHPFVEVDNKNIETCTLCGRERQMPHFDGIHKLKDEIPAIIKEGISLDVMMLHRFYEQHRHEILEDIERIGRKKAMKKWHTSSSNITQMVTRYKPELLKLSSKYNSRRIAVYMEPERQCSICGGADPIHYLYKNEHRLWLCYKCFNCVKAAFEFVGLTVVIKEENDGTILPRPE